MQTILGSGGTIGKLLAKELTQYTNDIRLVSRNPKRVNETDTLYPADLSDPKQVDGAIAGSEVVYVVVGFEYHISSDGDKEQQLLATDNYPSALQYIDFENTTNKYIEIIKHQISRFRFAIGALSVIHPEKQPAISDTVSVFLGMVFPFTVTCSVI